MEESAIRSGFANLKPGSAYEHLYESALCRQRADWLIGLNATRLFTVLYGGKLLKVGRVQTPTLAMLVEREAEIGGFRKTPYYVAHIIGGGVEAATERIDDRKRADGIVEKCKGAKATVISVTHEEKTVGTPKLYDLTTLQREANRIFGFTAKQTLEYTQSLYEKRLVTYPRTDSQFLSDDMGETARNVYFLIFESMPHTGTMNGEPEFQTILNSGKVTDHHAIIPTVQIASQDMGAVPDCEKKILSLIATRLLCAAGQKHIYLSTRAEIECGGERFQVSGKTVVDNGFKAYEDALKQFFGIKKDGEEEKKLPEFYEGQVIEVEDARVTEKFTLPPKRFTEDALLLAMERAGAGDTDEEAERKGLGTPATRADIIEKLVKDGYVKREKKQMIPTEDGIKLISVLPYVLKSPKLTADWENALTLVAKGEYPMEKFMGGIEDMVKELVQTYHGIGEEQRGLFGGGTGETLGKCPNCGSDVVKGKYGPYCKDKCGMVVNRAMGTILTDSQVKSMLEGKKTFVKGLKGKKGCYDAYLIPEGTEGYSYMKEGKKISGVQYKVRLEFKNCGNGGKEK